MSENTTSIRGRSFNRCILRFPSDWDPKEKIPLVIGLHGGGGSPDIFISIWDEVKERNFIFCALEAPYSLDDDQGNSYEWARWPSGDQEIISKAMKETQKYVVNAVKEISAELESEEIYLLGFSQGAIISYLVGISNYQLFNGLVSLSGPGLMEPLTNPFGEELDQDWLNRNQILKAKELSVFITHGKNDQNVKVELAIRSKNILSEQGYKVIFRSFDGGHTIPPVRIMKEIKKWIETQNTTG